jgi:hypothetical protein
VIDDARWEAFAAGTLADDEVERLRVEAQQTEEGRKLWDIYHPFDAEEKARLFENVGREIRAAKRRKRRSRIVLAALVLLMVIGLVVALGGGRSC